MSGSDARAPRAGQAIDDLCRACKTVRNHTVIALDTEGRVRRVMCDFCRSEHNYRGGGEEEAHEPARAGSPAPRLPAPAFPPVAERERTAPPMSGYHLVSYVSSISIFLFDKT